MSSTIDVFDHSLVYCILTLCLCISPCFSQVVYCKRTGDGKSETVKRQYNNYYESSNEPILEDQLRINFFNRVIDTLCLWVRDFNNIMSML